MLTITILCCQISTLRVLSSDETDDQLSEDEIFTSRQAARHVTVALKKYFETHLALRAAEIRRQSERRVDMQVDTSPHKVW
jgi:HIV-1 Vpr-binding protein